MANTHGGFVIHTRSVFETLKTGEKTGRFVEPGTVIALTGDLGSGKTAFTQGLAMGMGVPETCPVTSPSYTLVNLYEGEALYLYHVDLYRLSEIEEAWEIGMDEILGSGQVVVIEWADRFGAGAWDEDLGIFFEITGEDSRRLVVTPFTARGEALSKLVCKENG